MSKWMLMSDYDCGYEDGYDRGFDNGYAKALKEINKPMLVIQEDDWTNSRCPRCDRNYSEFKGNNDGYVIRVLSLERCPYCGQKIKWNENDE